MRKSYLLLVFLFLVGFKFSKAQDSTIVIGIHEAPPFVHYKGLDHPEGLSIDFWKLLQSDVHLKYRYKRYENLPDLLEGLQKGEVDMSINPITVTDERMTHMRFSQPFFISGTAIARKHQNSWWKVLKNVFSWKFFSAIFALLLVIFIFGLMMWYFERKRNESQFGSGWRGLSDGFWWSAVTMTTVGYGDKAPVTSGGRIVGFVWMFAAIIMISSLTASIASALTVSTLGSKISSAEDLKKFSVGTVQGSSSDSYLSVFNVKPGEFSSVQKGLQAVQKDELEVFVYDRPIMRYYIDQLGLDDVKLFDKNLKTDYYSFSYPKGSKLRDFLDPAIVRELKSPQWSIRLKDLNNDEE